MSHTKKLVYTAVCTALCVVLPMAFHAFPNGGNIFLPMHIPVLLCGLSCSWQYGLLCGILGPVLSHLLNGMPPAAVLPSMTVECAVYGAASGILMALVHTKKPILDLYISQISAMLLGRVVAGLVKGLILAPGTPLFAWVTTSFVTGLPGVVIQLLLLPAVVLALTKARLIPDRDLR